MKKLLVFILCLASTTLFAQELHYVINELGVQGTHTTVTGVFALDGVEILNGEGMQDAGGGLIEIGVFDQDGECRGAKFPVWRAKSNQWIYILKLRGDVGFTYPTFKVYDHATETEYEYVLDINETFVWTSNGKYGSTTAPYLINFTNPGGGEAHTFTKDILGFGDDTEGRYYLISSPIGEVSPIDVENMVSEFADGYDLYYFDQSKDNEWINYKPSENSIDPGFNLMGGKGYLYANRDDVTLTFSGTPYDGDGVVELEYVPETEFTGWNLVGNPLPGSATIDAPYYRMNEDGTELVSGMGDPIEAMEGVFVFASEEGQSLTFVPYENNGNGKYNLSINLASSAKSSVIDRVVVNFAEGQELPKFQINSNSTKVFVPKENQDYAVVNAGQAGELPVNFKTQSNGRYTFVVSTENISFSYLHLIDNKTGADVDLLDNPSYSFDALSTDYASRFRLVFSTSCSIDGDSFSFVNGGGNLCIFGVDGEATLQVVDVLGHLISSETFCGSYEKQFNVAPGVYMLRLIQGNDVKVQKMVIK